ncbi:hypothetical protein [Streptomyces blastmyceticus]
MPTTPSPGPAHRDADALNAEIRAFLVARRGRALSSEERAEYEELRTRWVEAVRARYDTAA